MFSAGKPHARTSVRFFAIVAGPLFLLYLATANWTTPYNIDALTNVLTANEIARHGDAILDEYEILATPEFQGRAAWVVRAGDSAAAQYPPGAALTAAPLYVVWPGQSIMGQFVAGSGETAELPIPPLFPAALASAGVTSIAVGLLGLGFRKISADRTALIGAYVAGLATGAWSVASDSLWQHGPAAMWIAAAILLSSGNRIGAGFGFGAAVLTRPHTALIAAGNGLWQSWEERRLSPALGVGLGALVGLAVLVGYNWLVFNKLSISGGYGGEAASGVLSADLVGYARNISLALISPTRGLLIYSPFLVLLLVGVRPAWGVAPPWVRGSALGGLLYLLVQLKVHRFSGGEGFWGYRYPLEALAAAAPLLLLSYTEWISTHRSAVLRRVFLYLVAVSIAITALGAVYFSSFWAGPTG